MNETNASTAAERNAGRAGESAVSVADVSESSPADWDRLTVDPPGGHVLQGSVWAEHRRSLGWQPHFVQFTDGRAALTLTRRQPPLPGFLAYAPRGPVSAGDGSDGVAERAIALAEWSRARKGTILAVDPVLPASETYESALTRAGFRVTEEIQPSRNRLVLSLTPDEDEIFHRFAKSTRQRIRAAEESGTSVVEDGRGEWLAGFGELMDATAERKSFRFHAASGFLAWWQRVLAAGQARFFVALHDEQLLGGLLAYLQGGQYATAFSADRAAAREQFPGTMHLLRWTIIRAARAAGVNEVDLGGVDLPGFRGLPRQGDPSWGMYQHKSSFGAQWVESAPAHEIVLRPATYRAGLIARALRRSVRRGAAA